MEALLRLPKNVCTTDSFWILPGVDCPMGRVKRESPRRYTLGPAARETASPVCFSSGNKELGETSAQDKDGACVEIMICAANASIPAANIRSLLNPAAGLG